MGASVVLVLNGWGVKLLDEFVAKKIVQFANIEETSDATVELSEIMWKVVFVEFDANLAVNN